jgi:hypothetical protein
MMEGLARLVSESLARHGVNPVLDHRRLQWSEWLGCESNSSFALVPGKPGLFALAEEVITPGEESATEGNMLAVFQVSETDDLGLVLGRMFLLDRPGRDRLASGRCFARYVVIEDPAQRRSVLATLRQSPVWRN